MKSKRRPLKFETVHSHRSPNILMATTRRYSVQIADRFRPDKIILLGSYAYGQPNEDGDVDLLVILPARNKNVQAVRVPWHLPAPLAMGSCLRGVDPAFNPIPLCRTPLEKRTHRGVTALHIVEDLDVLDDSRTGFRSAGCGSARRMLDAGAVILSGVSGGFGVD